MRMLFILMMAIGALIGIGYPHYIQFYTGERVGEFDVYDKASGWKTAQVALSPDLNPIILHFDGSFNLEWAGDRFGQQNTAVEIEVAKPDGSLVLKDTVQVGYFNQSDRDPGSGVERQSDATDLFKVSETGDYTFRFKTGTPANADLVSGTIRIVANAQKLDKTIPPIGYAIGALGFIGLILSVLFRRRRRRSRDVHSNDPRVQHQMLADEDIRQRREPMPKWGRGPDPTDQK